MQCNTAICEWGSDTKDSSLNKFAHNEHVKHMTEKLKDNMKVLEQINSVHTITLDVKDSSACNYDTSTSLVDERNGDNHASSSTTTTTLKSIKTMQSPALPKLMQPIHPRNFEPVQNHKMTFVGGAVSHYICQLLLKFLVDLM